MAACNPTPPMPRSRRRPLHTPCPALACGTCSLPGAPSPLRRPRLLSEAPSFLKEAPTAPVAVCTCRAGSGRSRRGARKRWSAVAGQCSLAGAGVGVCWREAAGGREWAWVGKVGGTNASSGCCAFTPRSGSRGPAQQIPTAQLSAGLLMWARSSWARAAQQQPSTVPLKRPHRTTGAMPAPATPHREACNTACTPRGMPRSQPTAPPTFSLASTLLVVEDTAEPTLVRAAPVARPTAGRHRGGRRQGRSRVGEHGGCSAPLQAGTEEGEGRDAAGWVSMVPVLRPTAGAGKQAGRQGVGAAGALHLPCISARRRGRLLRTPAARPATPIWQIWNQSLMTAPRPAGLHPPADSLTAADAAVARSLMRSLWSSSFT